MVRPCSKVRRGAIRSRRSSSWARGYRPTPPSLSIPQPFPPGPSFDGEFWPAEPEHQDYLERHPDGYTCHFPRTGWKLPRRTAAAT
jgi:hypothetical protein